MLNWFRNKRSSVKYKKMIKAPHVQEFRAALMNELRRQVPGEQFDIVIVPNADAVDGVGFQIVTESSRVIVAWAEIQYAMQESLAIGGSDFHRD